MAQSINKTRQGMRFAFLAAVISGVAIVYSKISVAKIDPLLLTTSRNLLVAFLFIGLLFFTKKLSLLGKLTKKNLILLVLIGVIGGALPFYLFFTGLQSVNAQTANIIHKSLFLWVSLMAVGVLHERFSPLYLVSYLLIIAGNFYVAPAKLQFNQGALLVLIATMLWSAENILAKKVLPEVASEVVGLFRMGIGSLLLLGALLATKGVGIFLTYDLTKFTTVLIGAALLFGYVYFWYKALSYAPASLVTLVLTFSVVVGSILSGTFIGLRLTNADLFSSLFIAAGISVAFLQSLLRRKPVF